MFKVFIAILQKDLRENFLSNKAWFSISFFMLSLLIFPLSFGKGNLEEQNIIIPAIWIAALFSNLIALEQMYKDDFKDGTLLYYSINGISMSIIVVAKCISHWLFCGLPIAIIAPISSYIFSGESNNFYLFLTLFLGTAILTLIGSPISAIMLGISARGPMLTFITLPFYLPTIIFGVMGSNVTNNNINAEIYLLLAILSLGIVIFPILTIKILRTVIN